MLGRLQRRRSSSQASAQLGNNPSPPLRLGIELLDAGVLAALEGRVADTHLRPDDGLHKWTGSFQGARGGGAGVDGVAGDEEDGALAGDAVGAGGDVDGDEGVEWGDGVRGRLCGGSVQGVGGGAGGGVLVLLLARELVVEDVPELRGQVGQHVAVLREQEGFAFSHAAGRGQLHGRRGFPRKDVARVGHFDFQFGDALDEAGGVDEPLAEDGVFDLGAGGVALWWEDGEEAAVRCAFVVDVFEELVGVLDVGGQIASVAVAFGEGATCQEDFGAGGVVLPGRDLVADAVERERVGRVEVVVEGVEVIEPVESVIGVGLVINHGKRLEQVAEGLGVLFQLDESRGGTACVAEVRAVEEVVLVALFSIPLCKEVGTIRASERMSGHGVNRLNESSVVGRFFRRKLYTLPSGRPLRRLNGGTLTVKCFCVALSISLLVSWG